MLSERVFTRLGRAELFGGGAECWCDIRRAFTVPTMRIPFLYDYA